MRNRFVELFMKQYLIDYLAQLSQFFKQWHIQLRLNAMSIDEISGLILEEKGYLV